MKSEIQHDRKQLDIALRVIYEAESILRHMLRNVSNHRSNEWGKAFALHLNAIKSVCMSVLSGCDFNTTDHMSQKLEGRT